MSAPSDEILAAIEKDLKAATAYVAFGNVDVNALLDLLEGLIENVDVLTEQIKTAIDTYEYTREFPDDESQ